MSARETCRRSVLYLMLAVREYFAPSRVRQSHHHSAPRQGPLDRIKHGIEVLAYILSEEAQHEITVLLQQLILAAVSAISLCAGKMLRAVQFDRNTQVTA